MSGLLDRYEELLASDQLRPDPEQRAAAEVLARVQSNLENRKGTGFFRRLTGKSDAVRGAYLWGGVGRGKSMLMDLFHESLDIPGKRRVHFHAFMIEVHQRIRREREKESGDPIGPVASAIAAEIRCLAFDEMVVNNSADAMIMSRLFRALIVDEGVTVVTTSNRPPRDLYKDGLNREHFLPFIELIGEKLDVVELNGPTDYRLDRIGGMESWHSPIGPEATAQVRELFFRLTDFNPEIERQKGGKEAVLRKSNFTQYRGESEAVQQAEGARHHYRATPGKRVARALDDFYR